MDYSWRSGTHRCAADEVDTDYVLIGLRIATTGTDEDETLIRDALQPQARIVAASAIPFEPQRDPAVTRRAREALLPQDQRLSDTYGTVRYDIRAVTDWEWWTYAVAGQFALSPEDTAMYPPFASPRDPGRGHLPCVLRPGSGTRVLLPDRVQRRPLHHVGGEHHRLVEPARPEVDQMRHYRIPELELVDE